MGIQFWLLGSKSTLQKDLYWRFGMGSSYVYNYICEQEILAVVKADHQIAKFNSLPNFLAI